MVCVLQKMDDTSHEFHAHGSLAQPAMCVEVKVVNIIQNITCKVSLLVVEHRHVEHVDWCDDFIYIQRFLYRTTLELFLKDTHREGTPNE